MQRIKFLKSQFKKVQKEAKRIAVLNGGEVCGLILNNGAFFELVQVRNKTKSGGGFSFYFSEIRAIERAASLIDHEIVGTFHSHPVGLPQPGFSDLFNAVDDSLLLIFDVLGHSARLWHVKNQKSKPIGFSLAD